MFRIMSMEQKPRNSTKRLKNLGKAGRPGANQMSRRKWMGGFGIWVLGEEWDYGGLDGDYVVVYSFGIVLVLWMLWWSLTGMMMEI
jgi:hypothetical protein